MNLSLGFTLHWGSRVETQSELFREIVYCENAISNFRSTTSNWQDYIPALRLNPFSIVSATARDISARRASYMSKMDQELDKKLENGTYKSCIRANVKLDPEGKLNESELTSLNVTMTAAGLDTMQSTVSWGIAILAMKPDIQEKALKEIRNKYPQNQPLCDASDDQTIEYISVLAKEILRFVASKMERDKIKADTH
jgi:3-hydroxyphenylacetate 6-hydroxylase